MITPLEALYNWATDQPNETRWLHDADMAEEYVASGVYMEHNDAALQKMLSAQELAEFKKYKDNRNLHEDLHSEMVFAQGVAIGVSLGSLRP